MVRFSHSSWVTFRLLGGTRVMYRFARTDLAELVGADRFDDVAHFGQSGEDAIGSRGGCRGILERTPGGSSSIRSELLKSAFGHE